MTPPRSLPVSVDPVLQEEAVLRAVAGRREERDFRRARDALYAWPGDDRREKAFRALHAEWFDRLRLGWPIDATLAELPILARHCERCLVAHAPTARDEGADLLVAEDGGAAERTIALRLRAAAFTTPEGLTEYLRAELLHVADMVDPEFGYEPELSEVDGGPSYARLLRDRYRTLWNVRIAGLLARGDRPSPAIRESAMREFAVTFPMLGEDAGAAFHRFFAGVARTHTDLVAFATAPRASGDRARSSAGAPCPLCRFPTYELEPQHLPPDLVATIRSDFPAWHPAEGLCRQCADLYRARSLSLAAAAHLPG